MTLSGICKVCGEDLKSQASLHKHLKKHKMDKPAYYEEYYPRLNKLTNKPIKFKNEDQYFFDDFENYKQMVDWLEVNGDQGKIYCASKFAQRINLKDLKTAPSHVYCLLSDLPNPFIVKKYWGTYKEFCNYINLEQVFTQYISVKELPAPENATILIDTREQKPLDFANSRVQKLHVGDYTLEGANHNNVFIERKSESDFKGTFTGGIDRFKNELQLAVDNDSYLVVLVESFIEKINKENGAFGNHPVNLTYLWHNVKEVLSQYSNNVQFVFSGNRAGSKFLLPRLLNLGDKIRKVDVQYFIDTERKTYEWLGM